MMVPESGDGEEFQRTLNENENKYSRDYPKSQTDRAYM